MAKDEPDKKSEKPTFPEDPLLNKRPEPPAQNTRREVTGTGGPSNTGMDDAIGPAEGGAAPVPVYRPGQRSVAVEGEVKAAPPVVHIPYGSEPRTYDPATGRDNPGYKPVADEDVRDPKEARRKAGL